MSRQHQHTVPPAQEMKTLQASDLDQESLQARIDELEQQCATLREGLESRQSIGFVTGVLAHRYGLDPDQAWTLLAHVSQELNVKVRRVVEVMLDVYCGRLDPADAALAADVTRLLPASGSAPQHPAPQVHASTAPTLVATETVDR